MMSDTHRIVPVRGHYEVYDSGGHFILSGDTWNECYSDLSEILIPDTKRHMESDKRKPVVA